MIKSTLGTNLPDWMTWSYGTTQPRTLNFYWPDQPLNFPSFSVTHQGADTSQSFEGDRADGANKGIEREGLMEINCWVSELNSDGSKNERWMVQLQTMRDMVMKMLQQNRHIALYNCSDPNNLVALNALVRLRDISETVPIPDPNPAVKRIRIVVSYRWIERF